MANIQPQTQLICCRDVRIDKNYDHAYYLGQQIPGRDNGALFVQYHLMQVEHFVMSFENYTYFREDRYRLRVKCKADDLWEINYIAYKNPIMGVAKPDKWFFGFVDETVYVNNETTDIYFTPDILTTWWDEAFLKQCFVERMHEPNDYFGKNITPEGLGIGDYKYGAYTGENNVIAQTELLNTRSAYMILPVKWETTDAEPQLGKKILIYDGLISGYKLFIFDAEDVFVNRSNEQKCFIDFMTDHVLPNEDKLLGIFSVPKDMIDPSKITGSPDESQPELGYPRIIPDTNATFPVSKRGYRFTGSLTLDGYLPANTKMYTAPYCLCELDSPNGDCVQLRHEFFGNSNTEFGFDITPEFQFFMSVFPPYNMIVRPSLDYQSPEGIYTGTLPEQTDIQLTFNDFPVGSYAFGAFEKWMAQQFVPTAITAGLTALGLVTGLGVVTTTTVASAGKVILDKDKIGKQETRTDVKFNNLKGLSSVGELLKDAYSWYLQGPSTRGKVNSTALYASYRQSFQCVCRTLSHQDAERIDRFFTVYGYAQRKSMQPMRCVRQHFTYLKTSDCVVVGNLPSGICKALEGIYNSGITFWADIDAIGEYNFERGGNNCLTTPLV